MNRTIGNVNTSPSLAPIQNSERIVALDIIRALALFGVLWVNFPVFTGANSLGSLGHPVGHGWLDAWVSGLGEVLVHGKAVSSFSMLFGIGLFIQFERAQTRGMMPASFAFRRLGGLFLIGFLHWVLIWNGDILTGYAIVGFFLLLFLNVRPKTFILAALLTFAFADSVPFLIKALHLPTALDAFHAGADHAGAFDAVFGHGSWMACVKLRFSQWPSLDSVGYFLSCLPFVMPMFLVGALLWKQGLPQAPSSHAKLLKRLFHGTIWLGLLCSFLALDPLKLFPKVWKEAMQGSLWSYLTDTGAYLLAIGYVIGLLRLLTKSDWAKRFGFLAPMGRMALTNYLSQSLVFTWVFYHHGLGLWGKVRPSLAVVIVVAFYALQIAWSNWWLLRFKFGPAEWLWRSMTYGKWQPFRIRPRAEDTLPMSVLELP